MKQAILQGLYKWFPFELRGDADIPSTSFLRISCVLPTYNRPDALETLMCCLAAQSMNKAKFDVIVVEDGQDPRNEEVLSRFCEKLDIVHLSHEEQVGSVAKLRNRGLLASKGEWLLFLDDDTVLLQDDFLDKANNLFERSPGIDCFQVPGEASVSFVEGRYGYLDKLSFAARCVFYRRSALSAIGGLQDKLFSYEDIDLAMRAVMNGGKVGKAPGLLYYHPPLLFDSIQKPLCSGLSFLRLLNNYSFPVWFLCYINALRFSPLIFLPSRSSRQLGMLSVGFLLAPWYLLFCNSKARKIVYR